MDMVHRLLKSYICLHHVEELSEMIEMDTWITQFGVWMEKLRFREDRRHGPAKPAGPNKAGPPFTFPKHFQIIITPLGTHQWTPKHLGDMPKANLRSEGLGCPSNGVPKWPLEVGLITQGWTGTYMQRNTKRINNNNWMEYNTSGGMDEFVTWIKGPTFRMDNVQPTANRLGRATPHRPSHNGG
jgi:hypothetical protein